MLSKIYISIIFIIFGILQQKITKADVGMPIIHISHDELGPEYPEMQEEVHLEDFFWTGSGDGPPDYLKKVHTGIKKGKDVIVKTETVVATVYVDGNNEVDIPICLDCMPDDGGGTWSGTGGSAFPPLNYSATDRRYWLLTVMSGFHTQKDNPLLEAKLAKLYRLAFTRQQTKHLGVNGGVIQQISGISIPNGRDRREQNNEWEREEQEFKKTTKSDPDPDPDKEVEVFQTELPEYKNAESELNSSSAEEEYDDTDSYTTTTVIQNSITERGVQNSHVTLVPWELIQQGGTSEKQMQKLQSKQQQLLLKDDHVRVVLHNITQYTEDELLKGVNNPVYDQDVNEKIDSRPIANQTELIYTVFVNGLPVLATTASKDMRLVSEAEVAFVIGNPVFMKAEPYLREPQATPLAPATRSSSAGFFESIRKEPALVIVSTLAILFLLLLLITLLLMGRLRAREKRQEINRTSSRNELISTSQVAGQSISNADTNNIDAAHSTLSRDIGIQNYSYDNENNDQHQHRSKEARIHFPAPPPAQSSRRGSLTSSENTSDSSVYSPINPPTADVQRILDEKAATLFEGHHRRHNYNHQHQHQYDRAEGHEEAVYTTIISEKKRDKARQRAKRRYLSENRVGSLETSPAEEDGFQPAYENQALTNDPHQTQRHSNYHRNKLLHQKSILIDRQEAQLLATEAINKEIIRVLQPTTTERSSDTGSIGSFLSMASVKAFPKNAHPEPLNRVLDPVFVTYYDNVDDSLPSVQQSTTNLVKTQRKQNQSKEQKSTKLDTAAKIESLPKPKAPVKLSRMSSQSDNPDPGVVGPVVWERHKKRLNETEEIDEDDCSPTETELHSSIYDPALARSHYEGLLEGAIKMYTSQDDLPMPLPTCDFTNKRKPNLRREYRGSSAGAPSNSVKLYSHDSHRPATAQPPRTPKSNHSTEPPSPASGAWGGSSNGSYSPLVRPMSAGPFHCPDEPIATISRGGTRSANKRVDLTAAPLIEAIQNELRKFKQEQK